MKIKVIGAGLAGCSCARLLADAGFNVEIHEKNEFIGGLCSDEDESGVFQHYGPHIFHTSNPDVIRFVLRFSEWVPFCNRPIAVTKNGFARLPFSSETICDIKKKPLEEFLSFSDEEKKQIIFDNVIKDYSLKQWGEIPNEGVLARIRASVGLGASYFNDLFEGLPKYGFTKMFKTMLDHEKITLKLNSDEKPDGLTVWTGPIDELDCPVKIKWHGTKFVRSNYDLFGKRLTAVYNHNDEALFGTRSTKMKMLTGCDCEDILIEIPRSSDGKHYAVVSDRERGQIDEWIREKEKEGLWLCGRSATARYLDMDDVIEQAFEVSKKIIERRA